MLTLGILGNFPCFSCRLPTSFKINFFKKFFQEHYQCQTVWIRVRNDILSVLIWVQTVCKDYQQTIKVAASKESVNPFSADIFCPENVGASSIYSNALQAYLIMEANTMNPDQTSHCLQYRPP